MFGKVSLKSTFGKVSLKSTFGKVGLSLRFSRLTVYTKQFKSFCVSQMFATCKLVVNRRWTDSMVFIRITAMPTICRFISIASLKRWTHLPNFSACIDDPCGWMQCNRLKLNVDKAECVWVTTRQRQSTFTAPKLTFGETNILPTKGARNLGVFFWQQARSEVAYFQHLSNMLMSTQIVANSSPITAIRDIKDSVTCLCLLPVGLLQLPVCRSACLRHSKQADLQTGQLQSVQNAAARLFGGVSKYDSVTPVLRDVLRWLPIKERINFKNGILTHKALNELAPSYLSEMLAPVAVSPVLRQNRSADRGDLTVPLAKNTSYGNRSFAIAAPMLWNSFPVELRCSSSMTIFCKRLKTYVCRAAYNIVLQHTDWSWLYNVKHVPEVLA